ncbi:MAG: NMD protein affecting ribosome stability and mRNA decay, partial [Methanomicrobiaceae archaeon]|nr:NMD protein affecting ribosome stability and mRNA decay [Methanomicrobiaceae archaeon]
YYEVRDTLSHGLRVFDLASGQDTVLRGDEPSRRIGNVREAASALVAYTDGDIAGIMDPESYRTEECPARPWLGLSEGSYIRVLRDPEHDRIVPVG